MILKWGSRGGIPALGNRLERFFSYFKSISPATIASPCTSDFQCTESLFDSYCECDGDNRRCTCQCRDGFHHDLATHSCISGEWGRRKQNLDLSRFYQIIPIIYSPVAIIGVAVTTGLLDAICLLRRCLRVLVFPVAGRIIAEGRKGFVGGERCERLGFNLFPGCSADRYPCPDQSSCYSEKDLCDGVRNCMVGWGFRGFLHFALLRIWIKGREKP